MVFWPNIPLIRISTTDLNVQREIRRTCPCHCSEDLKYPTQFNCSKCPKTGGPRKTCFHYWIDDKSLSGISAFCFLFRICGSVFCRWLADWVETNEINVCVLTVLRLLADMKASLPHWERDSSLSGSHSNDPRWLRNTKHETCDQTVCQPGACQPCVMWALLTILTL